eukprot:2401317-Heterocapsa_arctica.AAC.1
MVAIGVGHLIEQVAHAGHGYWLQPLGYWGGRIPSGVNAGPCPRLCALLHAARCGWQDNGRREVRGAEEVDGQ